MGRQEVTNNVSGGDGWAGAAAIVGCVALACIVGLVLSFLAFCLTLLLGLSIVSGARRGWETLSRNQMARWLYRATPNAASPLGLTWPEEPPARILRRIYEQDHPRPGVLQQLAQRRETDDGE
jgi:hypothetical protein